MTNASRSARLCCPATLALLLLAPVPYRAQESSRPKEAVAALAPHELVVPITGLTSENALALRDELKALTTPVFLCAPCKVEQEKEGPCPKCKATLKREVRALFTFVQPSAEEEQLELGLDPRVTLPLSRLEGVLTRHKLAIEDAGLALAGSMQLVVRAPQGLDAATLQASLQEAKLFETLKAEADTVANQILVTAQAGKRAPTRAQIKSALSSAKAQLVDVLLVPVVPRS